MIAEETPKSIAENLFIVRRTSVVTLTLFIYDYLCTLDDEIRLVWASRISLVKCVFFANRILAFAAAMLGVYLFILNSDGDHCYELVFAVSQISLFIFLFGEIILFTRVCAVWGGQRYMAFILSLFYLIGAAGAFYASLRTTLDVHVRFMPELFGNGCLVGFTSNGFWICYLVLLCHETVMLILIVIRSIALNRHITSHTVNMLIKDGILYFVCVLVMTIGNMLLLFYGPPQLRGFLIILQGILHSILCARLLLRLRGIYHSLTTASMRSIPFQFELEAGPSALSTAQNQREASIVLTSFSASLPISR